MIEVRDLSVSYGAGQVLRDVSVTFPAGRLTALLGVNGSGKSTLIRAAALLQSRQSGRILVDGEDAEAIGGRRLATKISYMAQARPTPSISARRMVLHGRFPYLGYPRRYRPEDYLAAELALERADAADLADRYMPELSGGQRQKVYLAMVLAQDADTVFMDEPTTYLDVAHQLRVMDTARELAEGGKAVVLVLHDLCMAMRLADEVIVLDGGTVRAKGAPEEIYASGVLDAVFGVRVRRIRAHSLWQYYCEGCQPGDREI